MRLAIADPPYPPIVSERHDLVDGTARIIRRSRARRWYGDAFRAEDSGAPADFHDAAGEWDNPLRHRMLLEQLLDSYDGWAIATTPDGLAVYGPLPISCRLMAWVKPNALPGGHRLRSTWEAVILFPPKGRRSRAGGMVSDSLEFADTDLYDGPTHLVAAPPAKGFAGAKPEAWTRWVLAALTYDPQTDTVEDLFPGSGAISRVLADQAVV